MLLNISLSLFMLLHVCIFGGYIWIPHLVAVYTLAGTYLNCRVRSCFIRYVILGYSD